MCGSGVGIDFNMVFIPFLWLGIFSQRCLRQNLYPGMQALKGMAALKSRNFYGHLLCKYLVLTCPG